MLNAFLDEFNRENNKSITGFDSRSRSALYKYDWPGNIRQLRNCVESAVVMCSGNEITLEDLPPTVRGAAESNVIQVPMGITMAEAEKIIIQQNLASNQGNKSKTADILGIGRKTLHRKLEEYGEE
jgi:DNA-binding NtrC family response regulator